MIQDNWHCVTIQAPLFAEEVVSAVLGEVGTDEVEFGGVVVQTDGDLVKVSGYFSSRQLIPQIIADIENRFELIKDFIDLKDISIQSHVINKEDWAYNWKEYYYPTRITRHLTILPDWITDYQLADGEVAIRLDPGLSFGTGTHPTTVLALFALEQLMRGREEVIDVGTGSGVLAIAASYLGADSILAMDIDDEAVAIAQSNIELNPSATQIQVKTNNLLNGITQPADIIIANMLAEVLAQLIDDVAALLKPNGHLILSGIYHDKIQQIKDQVLQAGLTVQTEMNQGEWHCLIAIKT